MKFAILLKKNPSKCSVPFEFQLNFSVFFFSSHPIHTILQYSAQLEKKIKSICVPNFFILKLLLKRYLLHMTSLRQYIVVFFFGKMFPHIFGKIYILIFLLHIQNNLPKDINLSIKSWTGLVSFSFQFLLKKECKFSLILDFWASAFTWEHPYNKNLPCLKYFFYYNLHG